MAEVRYEKASRIFAGNPPVRAVDTLDLDVADGEFLVLVGPSGSGKSTALRMLAGLEEVDEGSVFIGGRDVTALAPKARDIAMVFQSYALYPHMTVADNMGFALKLRHVPKPEIKSKVDEAARLLDLTPYLDRKPRALSGGQRQRVAMGRAIVRSPQVFCMDEPLSNLDAKLRVETRANIAALQRRLGTTTIYVTHDQVEAMTMGDRIAVLADGVVQQIGSPAMNLKTVRLTDEGAVLGSHTVPLPRDVLTKASEEHLSEITLGVRPESLQLVGSDQPGVKMTVDVVEELGADAFAYGLVDIDGTPERFIARVDARRPPEPGHEVVFEVHANELHLFHPSTGARLS